MAKSLSRRKLSTYVATQLLRGNQRVIRQLAAYLVEERRTKEAGLILRDVAVQLADHGTVLGTVISAYELEKETMSAIEAMIKKDLKAERIMLTNEIDKRMIGGYKLALPGRELDQTVRRHLINLRTQLKEV